MIFLTGPSQVGKTILGLTTIVMGSAKLNVYQKGGDSLMGRYYLSSFKSMLIS